MLNNFIVRLRVRFLLKKSAKITQNSKNIQNGDCFICFKGESFDGHNFAQAAEQAEAKIIITTDKNWFIKLKASKMSAVVLYYSVKDKRQIVKLLNTKYKKKPQIIAITGTNGKTSTVHFCIELLRLYGVKAASIGTLGVRANFEHDAAFASSDLTTPDICSLYSSLNTLHLLGVSYCFVEATSIALQTNRFAGLKAIAAGFTNFTQDHLDYHKTMDAYFQSKMLLFTKHLKKRLFCKAKVAINADIPEVLKIKSYCKNVDIAYFARQGDKSMQNNQLNQANQTTFVHHDERVEIFQNNAIVASILGVYPIFQCYNLSLAFELLRLCGFCKKFKSAIALPQPEGRMQIVHNNINAVIFIDFAHTPDALEKVLIEARQISHNKLIVLFGCGGDRDSTKRSIMGEIAAKYADLIIITSDNPRTEDPLKIISNIEDGVMQSQFTNYKSIADRRQAIEFAVSNLHPRDILVIAGKGAEKYQIIGTTKHPYSDHQAVSEALKHYKL